MSHIVPQAFVVILACTALSVGAETPGTAPVTSVAAVDLARYGGKWFEIANFPMFFQRNCIGDTTAEYGLTPKGDVSVTNRCRTDSGFDQAQGSATVVEGSNNARLKVSFFWPFRSDYWVIGLDADYRWAVVGNPNRKYLWVLSRTPKLPKELLEAALKAAQIQGFDLSQLRYTAQGVAGES
jgi:apolipoprotein D and lipocalin family protein